MRHLCLLILVLFLCQELVAQKVTTSREVKRFTLNGDFGYTQQNFNWSIAGNNKGENPNILSELKWVKIEAALFSLQANYQVLPRMYVNLQYIGSATFNGEANDTDYQDDNRTNPNFNALLESKTGGSSEGKAAFGYRIIEKDRIDIDAVAGFGIHHAKYALTDTDKDGPKDEQLNSNYIADWTGPYFGIYPTTSIKPNIGFNAWFEYSQLTYNAKANWNLIDNFQHPVSFKHRANGYGLATGGRFNYAFSQKLIVGLGANYFFRETGGGIDRLFLKSGDTRTTKLNRAKQNGYSIFITGTLKL